MVLYGNISVRESCMWFALGMFCGLLVRVCCNTVFLFLSCWAQGNYLYTMFLKAGKTCYGNNAQKQPIWFRFGTSVSLIILLIYRQYMLSSYINTFFFFISGPFERLSCTVIICCWISAKFESRCRHFFFT